MRTLAAMIVVCLLCAAASGDPGIQSGRSALRFHHLFWNILSGPNFRLFVDGKPVMDGGAPNGFAKETWQVDGNTLLLLSRDNTGHKRLSITPEPGSGLESMLGPSSKGNAR